MKRIGGLLLKEAVIVAVCVLAGLMALSMAYLIPNDDIRENVRRSSIILHEEGLGAHIWQDIEETMLDNYTDGLLLNVSYTGTKDGIRDILLDTYVEAEERNPMESLYQAEILANDDYIVKEYGRYWHGYQAILRPLLLFFTYADIRQINMILQLMLVFALVYILAGSKNNVFLIPFCGMYLFLCPVSLFSSLQYSACFYIMMFALCLLFLFGEKADDDRRNLLFLMSGILTAFFDLLTYPVITLGVPLLAYLGIDYERIAKKKGGWKNIVFHSLSWCIGYGGMWSAKWVAATLLTEQNIIQDALAQIKFRSGYFIRAHSYGGALALNLCRCNLKVWRPFMICFGSCVLVRGIKNHIRVKREVFPWLGMVFTVSLYPFVWYLFTKEHSSNHSYFTWRELAVSVFGILEMAVFLVRQTQEQHSQK